MKKQTLLLIFALLLGCISMHASDDVNFNISDLKIAPGEKGYMTVSANNWADIVALQFDVNLPEGLKMIDAELLGNNANTHTVLYRNDEVTRVVVVSYTNAKFSQPDILRLTIEASDDYVLEDSEVTVHSGCSVGYENGEPVSIEVPEETIIPEEKPAYILGDSNDDGEVDVADVTTTISYILGNNPIKFNRDAANVNGDEDIDVADVTATISIILNAASTKAPAMRIAVSNSADAKFEVDASSINPGEISKISVGLADYKEYVSAQFDVELPEGLTLVDVELAQGNAYSHSLASQGGRILVSSMDNRNFSDASLVTLTIAADYNYDVNQGEIILNSGMTVAVRDRDIISYAIEPSVISSNGISGALSAVSNGLEVRVIDRTLYVVSTEDTVMTLSDTLGRNHQINIKSGLNTYTLPVAGVYIINGHRILVK